MRNKTTVLLIYPHHRYWHVGLPWLPLSSMFLASTLLNAGYKTIIIDDRFSREETLGKIAEHIEELREEIYRAENPVQMAKVVSDFEKAFFELGLYPG